jgi:ribosomal protein S18 acetylase RimI-like enzyme
MENLGYTKDTDWVEYEISMPTEPDEKIALPSLSRALQKSHGQLFPFGFIHLLNAFRKNERADLYLVAVKSEYRGSGANAILMNSMYEVFRKLTVKKIETNSEMESNQLVQGQWKYFKTRQHKRRRVFIKQLG